MGIIINPLVSKWGLGTFATTSDTKAASGRYPLVPITGKSGDASFKVNGVPISQGTAKVDLSKQNHSFITYQLQCGSVSNIPMLNAGNVSYTAPTATPDSTSAAKGLVLGSVLPLVSGVIAYQITNGGSGYLSNFWAYINAGTFSARAFAYFYVTNGVVVNILPYVCSWYGYGVGYVGPNFPYNINGDGGSGCTFTCVVGNYIPYIPVVSGGVGLTTRPGITITDSTGSGAVALPNMSGPAPTDIVTYSAPAAWLTCSTYGTAPSAVDAPVFNYAGQLEGKAVSLPGFDIPPTMKFGVQHPTQPTYSNESHAFTGKDRMFASTLFTGPSLVLDSNLNPSSWTAGGTITSHVYQSAVGYMPIYPTGTWIIKYHDSFYPSMTGPTTNISLLYTNVYVSNGSVTQTVVGDLVTISVPIKNIWQPGNYTTGIVQLQWSSSDGLNHVTHPNNANVFRPLVMGPGNTDRGLFYDADDNNIANLTGPSGTTPSFVRFMDSFWDYGGVNNFCTSADRIPANMSTWGGGGFGRKVYQFQFARFLNTDPAKSSTGDNTYPWPASTKLYNSGWIPTGQDSLGYYMNFADSPNGASDDGKILLGPAADHPHFGLVELRSTSPHELQTGHFCVINPNRSPTGGGPSTNGEMIPWTNRGTVLTFDGFLNINVFVTGPNTIVLTWPFHSDVGTTIDTVNSTSEIPILVAIVLQTPLGNGCVPTEYAATFVSRLPHCDLWMNLAPLGTTQHDSTGFHYSEGFTCGNILGPTNGVNLEFNNEHWNFGNEVASFGFLDTMINFALCCPDGASIYGGYVTANHGYLPGGSQGPETLGAAQAYDSFQAGWVAAGRNPSQIKRYHGSWWGNASNANNIVTNVTTYSLACDGIAVAPYMGLAVSDGGSGSDDSSILAAFCAAGLNPFPINGDNWPVWQLNDLLAFTIGFNWHDIALNWTSASTYTIPAGIPLVCYEGGIQDITPDSVPNPVPLIEDMFNHPSYYDVIWRFSVFEQLGDWTSTAVGAASVNSNYFTWTGGTNGLGPPGWKLSAGPLQPPGLGLGNSYITPQGGVGGLSSQGNLYSESAFAPINQAPGLQAMIDWNAATSGPPRPPAIAPTTPNSMVFNQRGFNATAFDAGGILPIAPSPASILWADRPRTSVRSQYQIQTQAPLTAPRPAVTPTNSNPMAFDARAFNSVSFDASIFLPIPATSPNSMAFNKRAFDTLGFDGSNVTYIVALIFPELVDSAPGRKRSAQSSYTALVSCTPLDAGTRPITTLWPDRASGRARTAIAFSANPGPSPPDAGTAPTPWYLPDRAPGRPRDYRSNYVALVSATPPDPGLAPAIVVAPDRSPGSRRAAASSYGILSQPILADAGTQPTTTSWPDRSSGSRRASYMAYVGLGITPLDTGIAPAYTFLPDRARGAARAAQTSYLTTGLLTPLDAGAAPGFVLLPDRAPGTVRAATTTYVALATMSLRDIGTTPSVAPTTPNTSVFNGLAFGFGTFNGSQGTASSTFISADPRRGRLTPNDSEFTEVDPSGGQLFR